jgi:hypothetical protein
VSEKLRHERRITDDEVSPARAFDLGPSSFMALHKRRFKSPLKLGGLYALGQL